MSVIYFLGLLVYERVHQDLEQPRGRSRVL